MMDARNWFVVFVFVLVASCFFTPTTFGQTKVNETRALQVFPIGKILKEGGRTFIVLDKKYERGLLGLDKFSFVTVIYWFDRNDTLKKRSILQVHPRGNMQNPLRGVFATHSPVRPNLIGVSRCKIISVENNIIEIEDIDAFSGSPVIDLKS